MQTCTSPSPLTLDENSARWKKEKTDVGERSNEVLCKFTGPVPFLVELFDLAKLSFANPCKSFAWKRATRTQNAQVFCGSTQKTRTDHEKLKFAKFAKSKGSQLAWNLSGKLLLNYSNYYQGFEEKLHAQHAVQEQANNQTGAEPVPLLGCRELTTTKIPKIVTKPKY